MESQQQTLMFERKYIAGTVSELRERARRLDDAVEWSDSIADTTQHDSERRIISATLAAINTEYGPSYFSASTPSQETQRVRVAELTDDQATVLALKFGDGKPVLALIEEMASAGILSMDSVGAAITVPQWGNIGFMGKPIPAAMRCYLAWRFGEEFDA